MIPDLHCIDRRLFLRQAGLMGLGAATGLGALSSTPAAEPVLASSCTLTPSVVQGPFYRDLNLVRKNITEGLPGIPMVLFLRLLDVDGCTPLTGAEVEVWQNNAAGAYSNFASQGTAGLTWLRGVQLTDARGLACFRSIYPGWYPTRTTHVHVKVYPQTGWELTTQLYFHEALTSQIYALPPYAAHGPKPITNVADAFYRPETTLLTKVALDSSLALPVVSAGLTIVVDRP